MAVLAMDEAIIERIAAEHPHLTSRRSLVDAGYAERGRASLGGGFPWCESHPGVLAELGRIAVNDAGQARSVAATVEDAKPPVKAAIVAIRRERIGESRPRDEKQLAREVLSVVFRFRERYPSTTRDGIRSAFRAATRIVEELIPA